jgi:hypothetical protein
MSSSNDNPDSIAIVITMIMITIAKLSCRHRLESPSATNPLPEYKYDEDDNNTGVECCWSVVVVIVNIMLYFIPSSLKCGSFRIPRNHCGCCYESYWS